MDFLNRLKSKLQAPSTDKPIDITQAIRQAMDRGATPVSRQRTVAPNRFQVFLNPATDEAFTQWGKEALTQEFIRDAQIYAQEQNYSLAGSLEVELLPAPEGTRKTEVKAHSTADTKQSGSSKTAIKLGTPPENHTFQTSKNSAAKLSEPVGTASNVSTPPNLQTSDSAPRTTESQLLDENQDSPLLEVIDGQTYLLVGQRTVVGRGKNADIALTDSGVSHQHFEISRLGQHYVLRDLDSTNGTYVEGNKVSEATLLDRNIIQAGRIKMIFWRQPTEPEGYTQ